jgi:hypothetical protein
MARQKGKGKPRSKKKLSVTKQPIKDLDVPRGKGPKGGATTSSTNLALGFTTRFRKVDS